LEKRQTKVVYVLGTGEHGAGKKKKDGGWAARIVPREGKTGA